MSKERRRLTRARPGIKLDIVGEELNDPDSDVLGGEGVKAVEVKEMV